MASLKSGPTMPGWAVAASIGVVILVIGLVSWRSLSPNDPAMDGHGHKIFTPDDIARFRTEAASQPSPKHR